MVLIALVVLHVTAFVYYRVKKRRNLVQPMINGDKLLPQGTPAADDSLARRLLALVLAVACAAGAIWVVRLGG